MKAKLSSLIILVLLSACAHSIHQVHTSDFSPMAAIENGEMVKGNGEQFVIMGFVTETDYVNQAYQQLMSACPKGTVTGITTQLSTKLGFFSWTNRALMQGLCITR
jgi:hypothetical protein